MRDRPESDDGRRRLSPLCDNIDPPIRKVVFRDAAGSQDKDQSRGQKYDMFLFVFHNSFPFIMFFLPMRSPGLPAQPFIPDADEGSGISVRLLDQSGDLLHVVKLTVRLQRIEILEEAETELLRGFPRGKLI